MEVKFQTATGECVEVKATAGTTVRELVGTRNKHVVAAICFINNLLAREIVEFTVEQ